MLQQISLLSLLAGAGLVSAQVPLAETQSTGFNSSFELSSAQIAAADLTPEQVETINTIVRFDRSQLANGGPSQDDFYTLPPLEDPEQVPPPGSLLKVQHFTDPTSFAIPPNTALSRIMYTTETLNETVVPATAFVLWPFVPRSPDPYANSTGEAPVVLWTHSTSGFIASGAPSAHRSLWQAHNVPFALALEGYAVVAPDYAGLGISTSWDGSDIPHQYLTAPASAGDALYALQAAHEAFPGRLTADFVAMGHSQGGGVAWGVAEAIARDDGKHDGVAPGYLGSIAGSPTTNLFSGPPEFILPWVGMMLDKVYPSFTLDEWLTPAGIARVDLLKEIEGSIGVTQHLFVAGEAVINEDYNQTWYLESFGSLANPGSKEFAGPLLVIQGTEDVYVSYDVTSTTVAATCDLYPDSDLEYFVVEGAGHVPVMDATRQAWLRWIEARFRREPVAKTGCFERTWTSFLPAEQYLAAGNAFLQWAGAPEYSYQTPLGP